MQTDIKNILKDKIKTIENILAQPSFIAILDKEKKQLKAGHVIRALIGSDEIAAELIPIMRNYAFNKKGKVKTALCEFFDKEYTSLPTSIRQIVGCQLDHLTNQSFNDLLDNMLILTLDKKRRKWNTNIIINATSDQGLHHWLYLGFIEKMIHVAKVKEARKQAFPSDQEGRAALLSNFNVNVARFDKTLGEEIKAQISKCTKKEFDNFLDKHHYLTSDYEAKLLTLDNHKWISYVNNEVVNSNRDSVNKHKFSFNFSPIYDEFLQRIYDAALLIYLKKFEEKSIKARESVNCECSFSVKMYARAVMYLDNMKKPASDKEMVPSKTDVLEALDRATSFNDNEKETIKKWITSPDTFARLYVRMNYTNDRRKSVLNFLSFIDEYAKKYETILQKKEEEVMNKLASLVNENEEKKETDSATSCIFCRNDFKDLEKKYLGLLTCGHHTYALYGYIYRYQFVAESRRLKGLRIHPFLSYL